MVNDADREAARVWLVNTPAVEDWCGYEDQRALVEAFAAHRIAGMIEGARLMQEAALLAQKYCEYPTDLPKWAIRAAMSRSDYVCAWEDGSQVVEDAIRALDPAAVVKEAE